MIAVFLLTMQTIGHFFAIGDSTSGTFIPVVLSTLVQVLFMGESTGSGEGGPETIGMDTVLSF